MSGHRPKVFVSSTIYDFRDLRSALKFWLEELGFEVLLSEHNDFPAQVDLNTYESCLRSIDNCDYFILLVGSRVGGWYDATNRISITQAEYRRAYQRLTDGGIKLLAFVRQDLWDVREDRKELNRLLTADALHHAELTEVGIAKIVTHPSKFVNDAEFTFAFLNEIARIKEMKAASTGAGSFPVGNWIRQFVQFRDIIDAFRVEFRVSMNLRRLALLANLKAEIASNFLAMTHKGADDKQVRPDCHWASFARSQLRGGLNDQSRMKEKYLKWLGIFALIGCGIGRNLATDALDEALSSGEFLEFDTTLDAFVVGPLQQALIDLKLNIERLAHVEEMLDAQTRLAVTARYKQYDSDRLVEVPNLDLVPLLSVHDIQANVVTLSRAIYRATSGDASGLSNVRLYGNSPLEVENELMQRETPTLSDIQAWLAE